METLENMREFFTSRADLYDEHMLLHVEGCKAAYDMLPSLIPTQAGKLLDLGCGTGLELAGIFQKYPRMEVVGIDLTEAMLQKLQEKYANRKIELICENYFDVDLGRHVYDVAISFQTMHHFSPEKKTGLYSRIYEALKADGLYIECDYMAGTDEEESFHFAENEKIRKRAGIGEAAFYHYDTPCTPQHQREMLKTAGFKSSEQVFQQGNTTMLLSRK